MALKAFSNSSNNLFPSETSSANASLAVTSVFKTTKHPSQPHFKTIKPQKLWQELYGNNSIMNFFTKIVI